MNGTDLLTEFRETGSERAFAELVRRYTNLVYSVARRRLANVSLAQEAAQIVFIRLAKAVPRIRRDAELAAWLHRTTIHVSIDLWRSETRRRAREQRAAAMQPESTENPAWNEIAPILDDALDKLGDSERQAILLRFFERRSMRDLGARFGISEDAAKMRVSRALDKLRSRLAAKGATCTGAVLAALLGERSVEAAPADVALVLAAIQVPTLAAASIGLAGILAQAAKAKLVTGLAGAVVIAGVMLLLVHALKSGRDDSFRHATQSGAIAQNSDQATGSVAVASASTNRNLPDPRKLLRGVVSARQRILSGEMQLTMVSYVSEGWMKGTNAVRLNVVFDDNKFRYESFERDYRYTSMEPNASEVADARMRAENLDREAAEKDGLLQGFDSHVVTTLDDLVSMDYREAGDQHPSAVICEAGKGWGHHKLDPRSLGLTWAMSANMSPETCLGFTHGKSFELVGKESIDEIPCWDVRLQFEHGSVDIWIDVEHPTRVIKHVSDSHTVLSKYDESDPKNPIPREVRITDAPNGSLRYAQTITRTSARYNVRVPVATWTLAGLGMKPSTPVVDTRIHQRIGYWTGNGLSEDWPPRTADPNQSTNREEMLALLNVDPASDAGFDAAHWIIMNSPDGPDVERAADVILDYHIQRTNMLLLAHELDRMRHSSSRRLLEGMMDRNSEAAVRGNACFTLATLVKDVSEYGSNKVATAEAIKLFERVTSEFGDVKRSSGYTLAALAKPQLDDLRHVIIGQPAPETVGEDLDGQPLKLSDYRGKVVAVVFWGHPDCCAPDVPSLRAAEKQFAGKPFAIVGVFTDDNPEKARSFAEEIGFTWPSFKEERGGPIATAWHSHSWPDAWILDEKGMIRRRGLRPNSIFSPVEVLLARPQQAAR